MNKMYVLQVVTGKEIQIRDQLIRLDMTAYVPRETVSLHRGGIWSEEQRITFNSYVFVEICFSSEKYYSLRKIDGVLRLLELQNGESAALTNIETKNILLMCPTENPLPLSTVEFVDGKPLAVSGILKEYADTGVSIKYDKHRRRATLIIPFMGEWKKISLSFKILKDPNSVAG